MDLNSILPLLMGGGGDKMSAIVSALGGAKSGGEQKKPAAAIPAFGGNPMLASLLSASGGQNGADIMSLLSQMRAPKIKAAGIKPIKHIAPDDILGKIVKFLSA
jgi:hypothetical protein